MRKESWLRGSILSSRLRRCRVFSDGSVRLRRFREPGFTFLPPAGAVVSLPAPVLAPRQSLPAVLLSELLQRAPASPWGAVAWLPVTV